MVHLILYFTVYSILGWICECVYCAAIDRVWVNRGFLNGPVCPVYGFGALLVIGLLNRFSYNILLLFVMAVIITTAIEYITAVILENAFDLKWWDYSNYKFNYKGRICVLNSVLFGVLSVFLVKVLHPFIISKISLIPAKFALIAAVVIIIIFIIDIIATVTSLVDMNEMLKKITQMNVELKGLGISMDKLNDFEFDKVVNLLKKTSDIKGFKSKFEDTYNNFKKMQLRSSTQNRLIKAFPNMKSKLYGEQFKKLKDSIIDYWNKNQN
ncbi:putative ABC transporter permease [Clostridium sp. Ade.TY]|uniref:putative ABC transporter permease n=1 Tax=Clostridium sp. Ade.TY TaxID=1391647 RepID=UPI0004A281BF|nr:putative ABC transporter permease [Clostridium sp. Ade.TY]